MEEEHKELLNDNEIASLCTSINKLAGERNSLMNQNAPKHLVYEAEEELSYTQPTLLLSAIIPQFHINRQNYAA